MAVLGMRNEGVSWTYETTTCYATGNHDEVPRLPAHPFTRLPVYPFTRLPVYPLVVRSNPVNRHRRPAIAPRVATFRKLLVRVVLDPEDVGERRTEPMRGQPGRHAEVVGRIGKRNVERARLEFLHKTQRFRAVNTHPLECTEFRSVFPDRRNRRRRDVDEVRTFGAPGEGLETQGARPRIEIEHARAGDLGLHDTHPGFTRPVTGWTHAVVTRCLDRSPAPLAGDDTHVSRGCPPTGLPAARCHATNRVRAGTPHRPPASPSTPTSGGTRPTRHLRFQSTRRGARTSIHSVR